MTPQTTHMPRLGFINGSKT